VSILAVQEGHKPPANMSPENVGPGWHEDPTTVTESNR
jgi:hypothetical protein